MDEHVVARLEADRQLALDRVPVVVLADELVEPPERPRLRRLAPAPREELAVGPALLAQRAVRALEAPALVVDRSYWIDNSIHSRLWQKPPS